METTSFPLRAIHATLVAYGMTLPDDNNFLCFIKYGSHPAKKKYSDTFLCLKSLF